MKTTTTTLKSHHHFLHVVHRVLKRQQFRGCTMKPYVGWRLKTLSWIQLLPSTSFSSSYSCPKSSPPPFPDYTRQLSHLLGLTTGTPAITMEKFSFQNVSNRSRVYKPAPHSPEWAPCPSAFRQIWSKSVWIWVHWVRRIFLGQWNRQVVIYISDVLWISPLCQRRRGSVRLYLAVLSLFHPLFMAKPTCQW